MRRMGEPMVQLELQVVLLELQVVLLEEEAAAGQANGRLRETHYFLMHPSFSDSADTIWGHIRSPLCGKKGSTAVACLEGAASILCGSIQSHVREMLSSPDVGVDFDIIQATWEIEITVKRQAGEAAGPGPSTPASSSSRPVADGDEGGEKVWVVCMEKVSAGEPMAVLPCSHQYHDGCIFRWIEQSWTCPLCRSTVPTSGWFASTFNVRSSDDSSL